MQDAFYITVRYTVRLLHRTVKPILKNINFIQHRPKKDASCAGLSLGMDHPSSRASKSPSCHAMPYQHAIPYHTINSIYISCITVLNSFVAFVFVRKCCPHRLLQYDNNLVFCRFLFFFIDYRHRHRHRHHRSLSFPSLFRPPTHSGCGSLTDSFALFAI